MPGVDLNYFIRQANKLTQKTEERKKTLADETVEGKAGDGLVVAVASCAQEIKSLKIDPRAIDPNDAGMLEDLIVAAINSALTASKEKSQAELGKILPADLRLAKWNREVAQKGMSEMGKQALDDAKKKMGIEDRHDLLSFADMIEFDEERIT